MAGIIGFPLGVLGHRKPALRGAILPVLSFLQTIPSLAMFGLMIPLLSWVGATVPGARSLGIAGIGFAPAFVALVLYSLLPVVGNTVAGLAATPAQALDAARGIGMTAGQRLWRVELPIGLPVILTGIRLSVVIALGTATIGSTVAARTLGEVIIAGLLTNNTAYVLQGGLIVGLFAVLIYDAMAQLERYLSRRMGG